MDFIDLVLRAVETKSPEMYEFDWFEEVTRGMSYPRMTRLCASFSSLESLLLFLKLLQDDIYHSQPQQDHETLMIFLTNYAIYALRDRGLALDTWNEVAEQSMLEFAQTRKLDISALQLRNEKRCSMARTELARPVPEQMPAFLSVADSQKLYNLLLENLFISKDTSPSSFHYRMGVVGAPTDDLRPICWRKNKQLLRELLELCFEPLIKNKAITKTELEKRAPKCFIDRQGLGMRLSKNRPAESTDSDLLLQFFGKTVR